MRQGRVGIHRLVYALLIVALVLLPLIAVACGSDDGKKSPATTTGRQTTTTGKATTTTRAVTTTGATTTTRR
jgi:hypothetical protein